MTYASYSKCSRNSKMVWKSKWSIFTCILLGAYDLSFFQTYHVFLVYRMICECRFISVRKWLVSAGPSCYILLLTFSTADLCSSRRVPIFLFNTLPSLPVLMRINCLPFFSDFSCFRFSKLVAHGVQLTSYNRSDPGKSWWTNQEKMKKTYLGSVLCIPTGKYVLRIWFESPFTWCFKRMISTPKYKCPRPFWRSDLN